MTILFLNLRIIKTDIRPHIKLAVSLVTAYGHFNTSIFLRGCAGMHGLTYSLYHPRACKREGRVHIDMLKSVCWQRVHVWMTDGMRENALYSIHCILSGWLDHGSNSQSKVRKFYCLVQVQLRTEVLRTPSSIWLGFELMTSRSWQYISCPWDACSNHSAISDFHFTVSHRNVRILQYKSRESCFWKQRIASTRENSWWLSDLKCLTGMKYTVHDPEFMGSSLGQIELGVLRSVVLRWRSNK